MTIKTNTAESTTENKGHSCCPKCGGYLEDDGQWLGEDANGDGRWDMTETCEDCGWSADYILFG
jgi:hypothetical protein